MNRYEGMFLLDHGKVKSDVEKGLAAVTEVLEKHKAKVGQIGKWDERKLAYEINRQKRGIYILTYFEAPTEAIDEINRDCKLSEIISRQLITRINKQFPDFMTALDLETAYGTREFRDRGRRPPGRSRRDDDRDSRRDDDSDGHGGPDDDDDNND